MFGNIGGAFTGVLGSLVGKASDMANSIYQNYENRKATSKANQLNIQMWNAENAYNDPSAQMERLRNAGLNPNLVYGSGATTLSARSPSAEVYNNYKGFPQLDILSAVQAYQNIKQTDAQTQNLKTQNALINAQKDEAEARADIAKHNASLVSDTDYIIGEGFMQKLNRKLSGNSSSIKTHGEGNPSKDVIVYDKSKPAVGSNVKSVPNSWFPRFW